MPDHAYRASREPPAWWDHVLAHPFEHVIGVLSAVTGFFLTANAFVSGPVLGMHALPLVVYLILGMPMVAGGLGAVAGLQWPAATISRGWDVERVSWLVIIGSWGSVATILTLMSPLLLFGLIVSGLIVIGAALRVVALVLTERRVRAGVTRLRQEAP